MINSMPTAKSTCRHSSVTGLPERSPGAKDKQLWKYHKIWDQSYLAIIANAIWDYGCSSGIILTLLFESGVMKGFALTTPQSTGLGGMYQSSLSRTCGLTTKSLLITGEACSKPLSSINWRRTWQPYRLGKTWQSWSFPAMEPSGALGGCSLEPVATWRLMSIVLFFSVIFLVSAFPDKQSYTILQRSSLAGSGRTSFWGDCVHSNASGRVILTQKFRNAHQWKAIEKWIMMHFKSTFTMWQGSSCQKIQQNKLLFSNNVCT